MTCVTSFWILIISIHTSRFGNRIKQIWQPLLFINGYLRMEYTLFQDFAHKIPPLAPPTGRPGRAQSDRTPEFGYGPCVRSGELKLGTSQNSWTSKIPECLHRCDYKKLHASIELKSILDNWNSFIIQVVFHLIKMGPEILIRHLIFGILYMYITSHCHICIQLDLFHLPFCWCRRTLTPQN